MAIRIKFNPESGGYDWRTGRELSRLYPLTIPKPKSYQGDILDTNSFEAWVWHPELNDYKKHGGSLDPRTGMVLKGREHPTYHLTLETEKELGNTIIKKGVRYYSTKIRELSK